MTYISKGSLGYTEVDQWVRNKEGWWKDTNELDALWYTIDCYKDEGVTMINVDYVIERLEEEKDEPLEDSEQKLLEMCKTAREKGIDNLSVY